MLLGLAGAVGLVAGKAVAEEPKVLCASMSRAEYEKLVAEGKLPQAECKCCCPDDCC